MPLPDAPRLYLNEHLSPRLAAQLRRYSFDVTSSQESALLSETDTEQLAHTVLEGRAIVTFNVSDFARLHQEYMTVGKEHWGIIFSTVEPLHVLLYRLLRLLNSVTAGELKNQTLWLNDYK